jgi:hypothetical protein
VTLVGRVSETKPDSFFGRRNRKPWLKPERGVVPLRRVSRTPNNTAAERAGAARQAAKGMPSGPGVELLEERMESRTASRSGAETLEASTCLV